MYRVEAPPSIDIFVPDYRVDASYPWQVPLQTHLFRKVGLPQALQYVYERSKPGGDLTVISAACSTGAEADSLIALHNSSGFGGQLAVYGYDIHPTAIKHARQGRYFLPVPDPRAEGFEEVEATLSQYGFGIDSTAALILPLEDFTPDPSKYSREEGQGYMVDALPVRQSHQVSFEERDLGEGPPPAEGADLVLVNNMLYHLHPADATLVVRHLAEGLADRGVLSIGGLKNARFRNMGVPGNYTEVRFKTWLDEMVVCLEEEFDLQPLTPDDPYQPARALARA